MPLNMNRRFIPVEITTISAAQLAALNSTPIKILSGAALAADEFNEFLKCLLIYTPGATPFTINSATNFQVKYTSDSGHATSGTVAATGLIDQSVLTGAELVPTSGLVVNQGDMYLTLAGGNPSGGDGVLTVKLLYRDQAMRVLDDEF